MNRRVTGRAIAGAATVLALAGGGVAYAASGDGATTPSTTQTEPQPPQPPAAPQAPDGAGRAGRDGRFGGPGPRPGGPGHGRGFGGPGGPGFGGPGGPGGFGGAELGSAAADYLGLDESALREQLEDGRSLADVARAQGKSVDGLQDAIVAATKTRLDKAVDDGWLGAKQRDAILSELRDHVDELVAGTRPAPPRLGDRRAGRRGRDCPAPPARADRADRSDRSQRED